MKHILYYIGIVIQCVGLLACSADDAVIGDMPTPSDGMELTGIRTSMTGAGILTRGTYAGELGPADTIVLKDLIGRGTKVETTEGYYIDMEQGDKMVFTNIRRTEHSIPVFSYTDLEYEMKTQGAWTRDKTKGATTETTPRLPAKIYWSDASNGHTFIGYSCPTVTAPATFDWEKYTDDNNRTCYYGSLGDPTAENPASAPAIIDYNDTENGNSLIKADDILLTWADDKKADNAVANIIYHHGLALVRVIVNISGFGTNPKDREAKVSDMILKDMPTMYKWDKSSYKTTGLTGDDQAALNSISLYSEKNVSWDQKKDVHLWLPVPAGEGEGANRTFTFYALAVPHIANGLDFSFKVTYHDPMNPDAFKNPTYGGSISESQQIEFRAGWCTTLKISLNHKNEHMTIGAEYMDWEFLPSPDEGSLKKGEAFLASSDYEKATYSTQSNITIDNATWLYKDANNVLKDIYGNTGTEEAPFVIKTAAQFASFAKEVNLAGNTFEGKYIRMDADFYLQKSIDVTEKGMVWPGIGTSTTPFNGNIIGETRFIRHLYGKPLFINIGPKAHIEQLLLEEVLGVVGGTGAYAEVNNGIICASKVTSPNDTPFTMENENSSVTASAIGAFCGTNNGIIVGVYALGEFDPMTPIKDDDGKVTGYTPSANNIGGIVANNQGILAGAYSAIEITDPSKYAIISGCVATGNPGAYDFYCSDMLTPKGTFVDATGKTTQEMRNQSFVGSAADVDDPDENTLNGAILQWAKDGYEDKIPSAIKTYVENLPPPTEGEEGTPGTKTALEVLIEHLNSHYYTYQVASMPWIF